MTDDRPRPAPRRTFRATPRAWLALGLVLPVFAGLSAWQWQRGVAKQQRQAQAAQASRAAPVALVTAGQALAAADAVQHVVAQGRYLADRQLLLDGQAQDGQPGYRVWTPLQLEDGALVIAERGWIALGQAPDAPPAGPQRVEGYWRRLPEPGLRLAGGPCRPFAAFPAVVIYPTAQDLGCGLGTPVRDGLLVAGTAPPVADGFAPARHFAYAAQWAALALAALGVFVGTGLHRTGSGA